MVSQLPGNMFFFLRSPCGYCIYCSHTPKKTKPQRKFNGLVQAAKQSKQTPSVSATPMRHDWSPLFSNNHRPLGFGAFFQSHTCCHSFLHGLGWFTKQYLAILGCCFGIVILDKAIMYTLCLRLEWSLLFGCLIFSITVYPEHISP